MSADDQSDEEVVPIFRPFTQESLAAIEARIAEEKARKEAAKGGGEDEEGHQEVHRGHEEEPPEPDPNLEAGMPVPKLLLNELTLDVIATPLEDIDKFYENQKTFVVISKGKDIFRFSATNALYLLSPFNPIRRVAIYILVHPIFSFLVITTILVNCILMTFPTNPTIESTEIYFTLIYTFESLLKMLARGFILESFTYLRDPWNWLDFVVISLAYITMGVDLGNLSALRTFRVFRALKTVAIVPGLKTIVGAVVESVKNLKDVIILTCFSLSIFALLGLQIYMGVLTHKCILISPFNLSELDVIVKTPEFKIWADNKSNQYYLKDMDEPKLCRQNAGLCPTNYTCLQGFGENPNYGYTNFDSFGSALLSSFRLMTQDFWENLYQCILICAGPWHMVFFVVIIFLGSFYLVNLILAIVAMSYDELQKKAEEEEEAAAAEEAAMAEAARLLEEEEERKEEEKHHQVVKSPSDLSYSSCELFVGQEKGEGGEKEPSNKERASIRSAEGEKQRINNAKMRKASLSLPGSPFNIRRGSRASQFSVNWRNGRRYGDRKPLVLQTLVDAQEHLPYADDSNAVTPMSEENGAIIIPMYTNLQQNSYTSHSSRVSYNSHADIYGKPLTKESQLRSRSRFILGLYNEDMEGDDYMIPKHKNHDNPFGDNGDENKKLDIKDVMVLNEIIEQAAGRQSKSSERDRGGEEEEEEEEEKLKFKEKCLMHCLKFIDICCVWDCCTCWIYFQEFCSIIVFDPFMELFITLCIVVNTLFMALDHHNMDDAFETFLKNGNYFFTATFAIEAGLKLIAMSPKFYFQDGWNIFDFFIVALSLIELCLEGVQGLSVLRSFRLLRVFKLAKSWPTLNLLISIMGKTVGALGNLTFVLGIIIFIFAVMGMQLFGDNYRNNKDLFYGQDVPRWNFTDFMHSFMIVFRVLCGEWIESMWDCMVVSGWPCVPFFLATVVIGNLVVLNLFLALLLSSFGASNLSQAPAGDDTKGIAEAFNRIGRAKKWVKNKLLSLLKGLRAKVQNQIADQTMEGGELDDSGLPPSLMVDGQVPSKKSPKDKTELEIALDGYEIGYQEDGKAIKMKNKNNSKPIGNSVRMGDKVQPKDNKEMEKEIFGNKVHPAQQKEEDNLSNKSFNNKGGHDVILEKPSKETSRSSQYDEDDEKKDASKEDLGEDVMTGTDMNPQTEGDVDSDKLETTTADIIIAEDPADCCPDFCYQKIACCAEEYDPDFWTNWKELRAKTFILIEHKYFETMIITMIMVSSLALAAEDREMLRGGRPVLKMVLTYMDKAFTVLFFFEMLIKWLALGFRKYFTNAWCWLDFVIVLVSTINLLATEVGGGNIQAFKTMRTLRALRPLRALSRFQGMRVVVNALVQAIPAICNVLLVCLIFWLIFAIMGVQLFGGKYHHCRDADEVKVNISFVNTKDECISKNLTWFNPMINFDNVLNAYLALFQVATFKGWIDIMYDAVDTRQLDEQPLEEGNLMMYLYFVFFIIIGSFFTLNLFIGVIIDNFNEQKKKGGSLEMFMTEDQKKYYSAMKKMGDKKPVKATPRPRFKPQAIVFDLTTNTKFDMAIMLFIGLNMVVMAMDHYQMSDTFDAVLERLNVFFIAIFTTECVLKIFAFRWYYFKEPWNMFDFIVVSLSILGVVLKDLIEKYFVSPTLLRVVRVVKVGRVLRLVKGARGIRTLLFALAMSLPALFNICLLLFLVMFIYAIFGMSFFMTVKHRYGIDENFNFETFGQSMIILFQMSTSAGWDSVLAGIMDETDCDPPNPAIEDPGNCGSKGIAVAYLVSYLIVSFLIIINMYIAVILENYSQATEDVQEGLTADDYDMYYEIWQRFDPDGTQFIRYEHLTDFLDALEEPLQIPKPNKYKIISMDIAICKGDLIYCVDILDALTKDFFARKGHVIEETAEMADVVPNKDRGGLEAISSTLWRQREEYCARVIQQAWRRYKGRGGEGPRPQQQTAVVVESDGHVIKNGHKVVIHSRSPSVTSRSTDV